MEGDSDSSAGASTPAVDTQQPTVASEPAIGTVIKTSMTGREKRTVSVVALTLPHTRGIPNSSSWICVRRNFLVLAFAAPVPSTGVLTCLAINHCCFCHCCLSIGRVQAKDQPELTYIPYFGDEADARILAEVYHMK